jgi:sugar phosphate isomerase/epimerase
MFDKFRLSLTKGVLVYVACSSLCFGRYPLSQALHTISELRFQKVDLALNDRGPHLKASEVPADMARIAATLKKANVSFAAFHVDLDSPDESVYREHLRSICRMARHLAVPLVNVPAAPAGSEMDAEVARLQGLTRVAQAEGVILTVDTHCQRLTAEPATTLELCRRVPGLGITLDPSHYLIGQPEERNYDMLYPYVKHVRLRDTTSDQLQVRIGQGKIEYGKIINQLERIGYQRALSVDIVDVPESPDAPETEVRKLKYLLESMV